MHPRLLILLLPLACTPAAPGDDDTTTDATVTTSGSTSPVDPTESSASTTTGGDETTTTGEPDATGDTTQAASTGDDTTTTITTTTLTTTTDDTSSTGDDTTTGPIVEELPPIGSVDELEAWLAGGAYREWAVESGVHPSTGPHGGNVLTFVNAIALQSFADGNAEHPQDAATVKELYGASTDTIIGYAVSLKTQPLSDGGATWYWYERVNTTTYGGELGTPLCTGCHGGGTDYILTPYPLQ
jgi:hypothetical protein